MRATNRHDDDTGRGKGELPMSDGVSLDFFFKIDMLIDLKYCVSTRSDKLRRIVRKEPIAFRAGPTAMARWYWSRFNGHGRRNS